MQSDQAPLVSILVPTYNHAQFIEDCLNGIFNQICDFEYEVIMCDDASLDATVQIAKNFEQEQKPKIKGIFREQNIGMNANVLDGLRKCAGTYIALCEGDDYWTDSRKLQEQVNFMNSNPEFSICFHPVQIIDFTTGEMAITNQSTAEITTINELAQGNYIHTASALLRNYNSEYPGWMMQTTTPDYGLFMLNAQLGPIKMIKDVMAVYRKHDTGIWSQLKDLDMREKIVSYLMLMKDKFDMSTNQTLQERLDIVLLSLAREYSKEPEKIDKSTYYAEILAIENPAFYREFTNSLPRKKQLTFRHFPNWMKNKKN
jgi:glycosyltransferase involved in cell wall biosynthesis